MTFKPKVDKRRKIRDAQERLLLDRARPWPTQVPGFRLDGAMTKAVPRAFALLGGYASNDGVEVNLAFTVRREQYEEFRALVNRAMAEQVLHKLGDP